MNTLLGNVKHAIDATYRACSSSYAGRYLVEFGYRFNRCHQLVDLVPRFAYIAVWTPPLHYRLQTLTGTAGQSGILLSGQGSEVYPGQVPHG